MSRRWIAGATAVVAAAVGSPALLPAAPAAAAAVTYYRPSDGVLHIAGHGFGHGHGMSQWGAYGGATVGQTYQQILNWYYASPASAPATGNIKVQITSDGRNSDGTYDVQIKRNAGLAAVDAAGNNLAMPSRNASGTAYDVYRSVLLTDGTFRVQAHAGSTWTSLAPSGTGKTVTSWTGWVRWTATSGILNLVRSDGSNEQYRESLELDKTSSGSGVTVNRLTLEHYLAGVVSSEMPCSWTPTVNGSKRLDALEAQAVAARSYAAGVAQHPRTSQVDIVDSTSDQAYHGYSAENTALTSCPWTNADGSQTSAGVAAVAATAGQVMVDGNSNPIFAQYSASNGGFETSGGQSYLPARPDAWDGVPTESWNSHSWTDSITAGQLQAAYPSIGTFTSLTINSPRVAVRHRPERSPDRRAVGRPRHQPDRHRQQERRDHNRLVVRERDGSDGPVVHGRGHQARTRRRRRPRPRATRRRRFAGPRPRTTVVPASAATPSPRRRRSRRSTSRGNARSAVITGLTNDTTLHVLRRGDQLGGHRRARRRRAAVTPTARVLFHPLPPTRVLDTHSTGGAIGAGKTRSVKVRRCRRRAVLRCRRRRAQHRQRRLDGGEQLHGLPARRPASRVAAAVVGQGAAGQHAGVGEGRFRRRRRRHQRDWQHAAGRRRRGLLHRGERQR